MSEWKLFRGKIKKIESTILDEKLEDYIEEIYFEAKYKDKSEVVSIILTQKNKEELPEYITVNIEKVKDTSSTNSALNSQEKEDDSKSNSMHSPDTHSSVKKEIDKDWDIDDAIREEDDAKDKLNEKDGVK